MHEVGRLGRQGEGGSKGVRSVGPQGRERGEEGGGFTSIYAAAPREARKGAVEGEPLAASTILHHWRPFWTTQVAVRA